MIPPKSWKLQYLVEDGTMWADVVLTDESAYGRTRDAWNTVTFEPVTTKSLRVVMQSWATAEGGGSPGIVEWQVVAAGSELPDVTAPVLTAALEPNVADGADGWWTTAPKVVAFAIDDEDASPVIEVNVDGAGWVAYDGATTLTRQGATSVGVRAKDASGNVSAVTTLEAMVDTVAPVSSGRFDKATGMFTLRSADATSGVALMEYRLGSGAWTTWTEAVAVPEGTSTIQYRSVDVAGNVESARTLAAWPVVANPSPTTSAPAPTPVVDVYSTPAFHVVNGRHWYTTCEPYSSTIRCRTEIWSSNFVLENGKVVARSGWVFNNLTYLPMMTKAQWGKNPLANAGTWTATDGRQWKTECSTAVTGANACRSYLWSSYVKSTKLADGSYQHSIVQGWVLNNIVRFKVA